MGNADDTQRVIETLRAHRGRDFRSNDVAVVADAEIRDLYAARIGGVGADYLVHPEAGLVEEVSFDEWPPRPPGRRA